MSRQRAFWHPRGVLCAVCRSPAAGFGWFDPGRRKVSPPSQWFCSIGCQGYWWRRHRDSAGMFDLQPEEKAALRTAMKPVAEIMEEIGWERRLCDLDEAQVLTLIEVAVGGYQDAMQAMAKADEPEVPF
jgi:hypothetical protein